MTRETDTRGRNRPLSYPPRREARHLPLEFNMPILRLCIFAAAIVIFSSVHPAFASGEGWETDLATALEKATAQGRPVLADFSGSDWCVWCQRLDEQVFAKDEFKAFAAENLILCVIDFPRDQSVLAEGQAEKNAQYRSRFPVKGFPTVFLLEPDGAIFLQTGYREGGPAPYVSFLASVLDARAKVGKLLEAKSPDLAAAEALLGTLPEEAALLKARLILATFPEERIAERAGAAFSLVMAGLDPEGKHLAYLEELGDKDQKGYFRQYCVEKVREKLNSAVNRALQLRDRAEAEGDEKVKADALAAAEDLLALTAEAEELFETKERKVMNYVFRAVAYRVLGDQENVDKAWQDAVDADPEAQILERAKAIVQPSEPENEK